jgi:pimeloyl-ACP methyl ester carboxylesterase
MLGWDSTHSPSVLRRLWLMGVVGLLSLVVAYAAVCIYVVLVLSRPPRVSFAVTPEHYGLRYEPVRFTSRVDSIPLDGWLLDADPGAARGRPVVVIHGRASDRVREARGHMLDIAARLVHDGHDVLLFDLRGSGQSGGERYTLGKEEVRDAGGAVDVLTTRGRAPDGVDLLGYSMGGATALLFAPDEPLVRAVAVDSAYAALGDLIDREVPAQSGLPPPFTPGITLAAQWVLDLDLYRVRPVDAVGRLAARRVPLLVIHGEADGHVPVSHGQRLVDAYGGGAESLFVPGADHVASYAMAPAVYLDRLTDFLRRADASVKRDP